MGILFVDTVNYFILLLIFRVRTYIREDVKAGGSAKLEATFFNDTFNILNQKQVGFYGVIRLL